MISAEIQLFVWVLASFAIGCGGLIAAERASQGRGSLWDTAIGGIVAEVTLFAYFIGLPFAAVIAGALSLDLLGLGASWANGGHIAGFTIEEWVRGALIAAGAVVFVLLMRRWSLHGSTGDVPQHEGHFSNLRNAFYEQTHWAFYRAPFILLLNDATLGVAAGSGFIALEWLTHSLIQRKRPQSAGHWWLLVCCLLAGGALFLLTHNLWLMIAADLAMRIGTAHLIDRASVKRA